MRKSLIQKVIGIFVVIFTLGTPFIAEAGRGCCSWHGGQNYCDTTSGRWVCNDGTYSPTCGCSYIPPKPKYDSCSVQGLTDQYKSHKASGENMSDLSSKTWWSSCPKATRQTVYDKLFPTAVSTSSKVIKQTSFDKKTQCASLIPAVQQALKDREAPLTDGFAIHSSLDKVFYSSKENSCLYTTNIYLIMDKKVTMSYGLYDALTSAIIKVVNLDGTKEENDQRTSQFLTLIDQYGYSDK